ncbi:MAG: hypothetical protein VKJ24_00095 [Synechococcales bacterium]|nr:hypothetical protein [Synechococcales bacterium]
MDVSSARLPDWSGVQSDGAMEPAVMKSLFYSHKSPSPKSLQSPNSHSLAAAWARKYVTSVTQAETAQRPIAQELIDVTSLEGRQQTTKKLLRALKLASAQAWSHTESLLSDEVQRHRINAALIDPWKIAADTHALFEKALQAYQERQTPRRLTVVIGEDCGRMRQVYTSQDPRVIGFVSMQFHYTGQMLLSQLTSQEQVLFEPYIKVMDDHLYMPLRDAYDAAANHVPDSPSLRSVQKLLLLSTKIAYRICQRIQHIHPNCYTFSGSLRSRSVMISSIRDAEMFQVYLCLCVLENNLRSVQQQLFPLCVMLYPRLRVNWQLVRDMLQVMNWEIQELLPQADQHYILPHLQALSEMFAHEVVAGI